MKELLSILLDEETQSCQIHFHTKNAEELFALCHALYSVTVDRPEVIAGMMAIAKLASENPEVRKLLEGSKVEVPDFDNLLKTK